MVIHGRGAKSPRGRKKEIKTQEVWLWATIEAQTKIIPVMRLGPRTLDMAMGGVHELKQRMSAESKPVFSSDGLKLYFYALTAHMGQWTQPEGAHKPVWTVAADFLYAQVKKIHRRRRLDKVEHAVLSGDAEKFAQILKAWGLSGKINTAFIERVVSTGSTQASPFAKV